MDWYKTLNIHHRIWLKSNTALIVGIDWETLTLLFTFKQIIFVLKEHVVILIVIKLK